MMKSCRILYFFKAGRSQRLELNSPSEFFYGYKEALAAGFDVELLSDNNVGIEGFSSNRFLRGVNHLIHKAIGLSFITIYQLARQRKRFSNVDLIFVVSKTYGISFSVLKRFGLIKAKVFFVAMGLVEFGPVRPRALIYRWALRHTEVVTLADADAQMLSKALLKEVPVVPFGVDINFWVRDLVASSEDYVLSIGNDQHRDYKTLLAAWKPHFPTLKIITAQDIFNHHRNVEIIKGEWQTQVLSDHAIRDLLRKAKFVILPIKQTVQPSGQSVALQAMACSKTVLITNYHGLWNRELMRNNETCVIMGEPGDAASISRIVDRLLKNEDFLIKTGAQARLIIDNYLNAQIMFQNFVKHMKIAMGRVK